MSQLINICPISAEGIILASVVKGIAKHLLTGIQATYDLFGLWPWATFMTSGPTNHILPLYQVNNGIILIHTLHRSIVVNRCFLMVFLVQSFLKGSFFKTAIYLSQISLNHLPFEKSLNLYFNNLDFPNHTKMLWSKFTDRQMEAKQ